MRVVLIAALLGVAACPPAGEQPLDAARPDDAGQVLTEAGLARCALPGVYCTPADPCGLNPVCSELGVCEVSAQRDCDDGVSCTADRCVPGGCEHTIQPDSCLIDGQCYAAGQSEGCGRCDPGVSPSRWSPVTGPQCDDRDPCTMGDRCSHGLCVGQTYSCTDELTCTTDACDGEGGCTNVLLADHCLIEGSCHQAGATDATGCKVCDVGIYPFAWQTRVDVCEIDGRCHASGSLDATGCFVCDPQRDIFAWTALPNRCLISQRCLQSGALHPSGCALCSPSVSTSNWTPVPGGQLQLMDFTAGLEGFSVTAAVKGVGWHVSSKRSTSPPYALYYGDPAKLSYDNGNINTGVAVSPPMSLPGEQRAYLGFQVYMDTETSATFDVLTVEVEGTVLWSKATHLSAADYKQWLGVWLDLSDYAGRMVSVAFRFDTKDDLNNDSEGVYIDDVVLFTGCGSL